MKITRCALGALGAAALFAALSGELNAQATPPPSVAKSVPVEELSQPDLLKAYLQVREQLQATQLAIATNRIEAEVTARAQTAALTEKLEAIKTAMEAERERHRVETEHVAAQQAESQRQQAELQRSNRTILWVAGCFGGMALIAIIVGPMLQWRAMNRLADVTAARPVPQLPAPAPTHLLADSATMPDQAVAVANQRVQGMLERMERRILELEHTASKPAASTSGPVATTSTVLGISAARTPALSDQALRIKSYLAKGHALLNEGKPKEAIACYNEVLKIDLNHPEALVKRGAALERLKQDDEAIQCYDRAIKADSKMTLAYLYKGGVCNRLERYEEASKCYEQALKTEDETRTAANVVV